MQSKSEVGLDQYEVRSEAGRHRHMTLAMTAHALLASCRWWPTLADPRQRGRRAPPLRGTALGNRPCAYRPRTALVELSSAPSSRGPRSFTTNCVTSWHAYNCNTKRSPIAEAVHRLRLRIMHQELFFVFIFLLVIASHYSRGIEMHKQRILMRSVNRKLDALLKAQGVDLPVLSPEVQSLALQGNTIATINVHREEHPGISLIKAKADVEAFAKTASNNLMRG